MIYLDTSFVAPLVIAEATSNAVESCLLELAPADLSSSLWTVIALRSLIARKLRMGDAG